MSNSQEDSQEEKDSIDYYEDHDEADEDERAIVRCGTTQGPIVLEFHRHWSPHGYDRAVTLFERGFYDHSHFFRAVPNFLVQFGITYSKDPELVHLGNSETVLDDPQLDPPIPFEVGTISYAGSGPNSRTSQLFFSLTSHNENFGTELWETPVGKVIEGIEHVQQFYHQYGDGPPFGHGPVQGKIHNQGRTYIEENFPLLDSFQECVTERIAPQGSAAEHDEAADETDAMMEAVEHAKAEPVTTTKTSLRTSKALDWKLMGGGGFVLFLVAFFVKSLLMSGKKDPKKRK